MTDTPLFCWSCQCGLTSDNYVYLDGTVVIPACKECWQNLTVEQRMKIAQSFADRQDGGWVEAVTTVFRSALGRFVEEKGGLDWFRGRGN